MKYLRALNNNNNNINNNIEDNDDEHDDNNARELFKVLKFQIKVLMWENDN